MEISDSSVVNSSLQKSTSTNNQQSIAQTEQGNSVRDERRTAEQQAAELEAILSDPDAVQDAVEKLSDFVSTVSNRGLQISIDQDLSKVVLKVINKDNEETIRQIPTEEVLDLMKRMRDLSEEFFGDTKGLLVENKV